MEGIPVGNSRARTKMELGELHADLGLASNCVPRYFIEVCDDTDTVADVIVAMVA
jgi:hypothetical protein